MSNNKNLFEAINGYTTAWKKLFNSSPFTDQYEEHGIAMRWDDSKFLFSNAAFLTDGFSDPEALQQRLDTVVMRIKSKKNIGLLNICTDLITGEAKENFDTIIQNAGLEYVMSLNGMIGDTLPPEPRVITELEIKRVTCKSELNNFSDINCLAYGFDLECGRNNLGNVWIDNAYSFVGYVNNKPVCAASTAKIDNILYLALVATIPEERRKGYSEAIVRHALIEGHIATGLKRTLLHATPAGEPVYKRIGYYKSANICAYQLGKQKF